MKKRTFWIAEVRQHSTIIWRENIMQDARPTNDQWLYVWNDMHKGIRDNPNQDLKQCREQLASGNYSITEAWLWDAETQ